MDEINTGGPAFPRPFSQDDIDPDLSYPAHSGMSLRDYFAGIALHQKLELVRSCDFQGSWDDKLAVRAYRLADAMLRARGDK